MRALPRPQTREGAAAATAFAVIVVCALVIGLTPVRERPEAAVVLLVIAAVAGAVVGAVAYARRARTRHIADNVERATVEAWFTEPSLEGFPEQALSALVTSTDAPSRQRLQTAWIMATHGHDAAWLHTHLDLPQDVARLLADTAHRGAAPQP